MKHMSCLSLVLAIALLLSSVGFAETPEQYVEAADVAGVYLEDLGLDGEVAEVPSVDLEKLPPKEIPLKNTDWGITDGDTYIGKANAEGTVKGDPRASTAERGKRYLDQAIDMMTAAVTEAMETL